MARAFPGCVEAQDAADLGAQNLRGLLGPGDRIQVDELSLGRLDGRVASGDEVAFGVVEAGRGPSSDSM
ncbi:hypothetical protein B2G69_07405 [Methylorubrum zatmanii]|nr:hypothetical protein B2G69_07405 [Methylorubrum zatmanii]